MGGGHGKEQMEHRIMTEVHEFLGVLGNSNQGPTDLSPLYALSISNVICNIMMSVRFTLDDPKFLRFNFLIEEGMRLFGEITTVDYIPSIQYLPKVDEAKKKIARNRLEMFEFYREVIESHKATFDPNNIRDLIDTYLVEIQTATEEGREGELFEGKDHGKLFLFGLAFVLEHIINLIFFFNTYRSSNNASGWRFIFSWNGNN